MTAEQAEYGTCITCDKELGEHPRCTKCNRSIWCTTRAMKVAAPYHQVCVPVAIRHSARPGPPLRPRLVSTITPINLATDAAALAVATRRTETLPVGYVATDPTTGHTWTKDTNDPRCLWPWSRGQWRAGNSTVARFFLTPMIPEELTA